jgi:hypothetical protein
LLAWGFEHDNVCLLDVKSNIRLGQMAGAKANYAMYLACEVLDTLDTSTLTTEGNYENPLLQQFSFVGTIGIDDDTPADFFNDTAGSTNADAWLNDMPTSAIVVSYSPCGGVDTCSEDDC